MDTQEIMEALKYCTGVFPRQALEEAAANREQMTPLLLKVLEETIQTPDILHQEEYFAHINAMYLLAQFREKQAYPLIVEFFAQADEIIMQSMGDIVTRDLHRILASVAHGDTSLIKSLVQNDKIDEYIRSAAVQALLTQMVLGELTREELVAYYQSLFRGGLEKEYSFVWDELVSLSTDLYPEELIGDIREAYEQGLVNTGFINIEEVEKTLKRSKASVLKELYSNPYYRLIEDPIEDMEGWVCFRSPEPARPATAKKSSPEVVYSDESEAPKKKVGRNEPCPCGSGKKYKKCCGR
jgi:hypothetical protein